MAKKRRTRKPAEKPLTAAQKKRFMTQLSAAAEGLKTLAASVKKLRAQAVSNTYVGKRPMAGRARRRKRA